ncbi:dCTP deaminase domain-containing protein [Rhodopseudomonas parapalustris]
MIVGKEVLDRGLLTGGSVANLKNSTYDLTVGEIVPIGKKAIRARRKDPQVSPYFLEPREMVWVLSKEEFNMPADVTGFATLRTTFTKQGILALNVGIIDPFFKGPISTALINFSDRPRAIRVGDKFFRIAFFAHSDVSEFHKHEENTERTSYLKDLENASYADFSPSFMNIPSFDDEFYFKQFWRLLWAGLTGSKWVSIPLSFAVVVLLWFTLEQTGFLAFLTAKWAWFGEMYKQVKFW